MFRLIRVVLVVGVLCLACDTANAQFVGGFGGPRQVTAFQVRNGPGSSFSYFSSGPAFPFRSIYGPIPTWYYGWPGIPIVNNPVVVQPSPPVIVQNIIQQPGAAAPAQVAGPGAFVPPEFGAPAANAPAAKMPAAKPVKPAAKPVAAGLAPDPPKALAAPNGRADADRLVELGRKAFTDGQYGRALELFRKAADAAPEEASAQFLIAQAQFALGKYPQAVNAIAAGFKIRADWADARFVSRELYWKNPELYNDHLKALRQAVADFPNDATLTFLLGHQLWFDGQRDEARGLFQKAATLAKGQTPAESFLGK
ncbi:MAG TPA: tetratricopeptide repeat protein [Gemmataceae bacterium]|nr:tetratricopeptide repeat protein [Gemmataceae bacterium]